MKLAHFDAGDGPELGLVVDGLIRLGPIIPEAPRGLMALIADWSRWQPQLAPLTAHQPDLAIAEVKLLAPIPRPGKILGIGLNYADHIAESGLDQPTDQLWFAKAVTAIAGPQEPIRLPRVSEQLDYEAELVVSARTRKKCCI